MKAKSRSLWIAIGLLLTITVRTSAGPNASFTLPLHVVPSSFEPCTGYLPVDCLGTRPTTSAIGNHPAVVFLLVANRSGIVGLQAGLEWDPSWTWSFSLFDCQPGQLEGIFQDGPTTASGVTAFECLKGPSLAVIGRMVFMAGHVGCLRFRQPSFPFGIHVVDCTALEVDQITDTGSPRLGRICVGGGGYDACDAVLPVGAGTWGGIKGSYR